MNTKAIQTSKNTTNGEILPWKHYKSRPMINQKKKKKQKPFIVPSIQMLIFATENGLSKVSQKQQENKKQKH